MEHEEEDVEGIGALAEVVSREVGKEERGEDEEEGEEEGCSGCSRRLIIETDFNPIASNSPSRRFHSFASACIRTSSGGSVAAVSEVESSCRDDFTLRRLAGCPCGDSLPARCNRFSIPGVREMERCSAQRAVGEAAASAVAVEVEMEMVQEMVVVAVGIGASGMAKAASPSAEPAPAGATVAREAGEAGGVVAACRATRLVLLRLRNDERVFVTVTFVEETTVVVVVAAAAAGAEAREEGDELSSAVAEGMSAAEEVGLIVPRGEVESASFGRLQERVGERRTLRGSGGHCREGPSAKARPRLLRRGATSDAAGDVSLLVVSIAVVAIVASVEIAVVVVVVAGEVVIVVAVVVVIVVVVAVVVAVVGGNVVVSAVGSVKTVVTVACVEGVSVVGSTFMVFDCSFRAVVVVVAVFVADFCLANIALTVG